MAVDRRAHHVTANPTDAEAIAGYQCLPEMQQYVSRTVNTRHEAEQLIAERSEDPDTVFCVIELGSDVVGQIGGRVFTPESLGPEPRVRDFSLGYSVALDHWGKGIASAAIALLMPALHDDGVRRITARVFAENRASVRVLIKNGFQLEGTEREAVMSRDGRWLDDSMLSHFATA